VNPLKWFNHLFAVFRAGPLSISRSLSTPSKPSLPSEPKKPSAPSKSAQSTKAKSHKSYPEKLLNTPNVSKGKRIKPKAIVLHHTSGSYAGSVAWCMNPASRVSYHAIVAKDGRRSTLADPDERTWHAGVSSWRGKRDLNSWSIGAAFEGDTYKRPLSEDEMASMAEYLEPLMKLYRLTLDDVTDHRTVSPGRKDDLNPVELARFKEYLAQRIQSAR
jgi:N-acetyl-anhydromuramyl-L-alanine amidase AmpD